MKIIGCVSIHFDMESLIMISWLNSLSYLFVVGWMVAGILSLFVNKFNFRLRFNDVVKLLLFEVNKMCHLYLIEIYKF